MNGARNLNFEINRGEECTKRGSRRLLQPKIDSVFKILHKRNALKRAKRELERTIQEQNDPQQLQEIKSVRAVGRPTGSKDQRGRKRKF